MNFTNKKVTVFGLGKSGLASVKRLVSAGAKVMVTESRPAIDENLQDLGATVELGGHTLKSIEDADLIVVSPGVHLDIPVLEEAKKKGLPIISEIELAYQFLTKPIIAVTGTNGKTTTVTLIGEMLKTGGKKVVVAGNIGFPLVGVDDTDLDYTVAEISSYQLETIVNFRPWISVVLNLQPDHLKRHHSIREYINQKARIFMRQTGDDYVVYNQDDKLVVEIVKNAKARPVGFSKSKTEIITLLPSEIKIPGRHNLENSLAAAQTAYLCGISKEAVAEVLRTFPGVEHRIEFVAEINGVEFYNDSKGTNPDSTLVAIETFPDKGIILILGGREKGVSLEPLAKKVKEKVKAVVLVGEAAHKFEKVLDSVGFSAVANAGFSMGEAVKKASNLAVPGDIVLLSPACASFDMFNNYEERGKVFKQLCLNLKK